MNVGDMVETPDGSIGSVTRAEGHTLTVSIEGRSPERWQIEYLTLVEVGP